MYDSASWSANAHENAPPHPSPSDLVPDVDCDGRPRGACAAVLAWPGTRTGAPQDASARTRNRGRVRSCSNGCLGESASHIALADHAGLGSDWRAPADLALAPILDRIPVQLAIAAIALIAFGSFVRSAGKTSLTILLCLTAWIGVKNAEDPMPVVDVSPLSETAFLRSVRAIGGRVFERAGKDLDPIRLGVFGRYPSDTTANLAVAQARQAWALAGAGHGVRYAYDASPDGADRNRGFAERGPVRRTHVPAADPRLVRRTADPGLPGQCASHRPHRAEGPGHCTGSPVSAGLGSVNAGEAARRPTSKARTFPHSFLFVPHSASERKWGMRFSRMRMRRALFTSSDVRKMA